MLLAVVHANGTHHAHLGVNEPIRIDDGTWNPEPYWDRLADTMARRINLGDDVVYIPYVNNSHKTDIFTNPDTMRRALSNDPILQRLGNYAGRLVVAPGATGLDPKLFGHDYATERKWRMSLQEFGAINHFACFVGAYTTACVAETALNLARVIPTSIDPDLSVDIRGEGYREQRPALPYLSVG